MTEDDAGTRLDNFLVRKLGDVPRARVYRLLRKGEVRLNKKRARGDQRVALGDIVRIPPVRPGDEVPPPEAPRVASPTLQKLVRDSIVYEDADLIVCNKPPGVAVHGGSATHFGLIEALRAARPDTPDLELVHRLDRETSGCLLVAKRRSALRDLHAQLREGRTEKRYLALLCGKWNLGTKRIEAALDTDLRRHGERHVAVSPRGKNSVSTFKPVQFFGNLATLVEVEIDTGKTHQIRVHAAYAGHPVAGDDKYGDRTFNDLLRGYGLHRMFLHSSTIGFTRPGTREPMQASAPLPEELGAVLDNLQRGRARAPDTEEGRSLKPEGRSPGPRAPLVTDDKQARPASPGRRALKPEGRAPGGRPVPKDREDARGRRAARGRPAQRTDSRGPRARSAPMERDDAQGRRGPRGRPAQRPDSRGPGARTAPVERDDAQGRRGPRNRGASMPEGRSPGARPAPVVRDDTQGRRAPLGRRDAPRGPRRTPSGPGGRRRPRK
ncbi:MAG TPA: RluA family pseudouridine synthase [Steroidobacteraceae bacterium]|nr:RluA family pseudouridine synthase [Steroidobacteraceae bacterium]